MFCSNGDTPREFYIMTLFQGLPLLPWTLESGRVEVVLKLKYMKCL